MSSERLVKIKSGLGFLDAVTYESGEDGSAMQPVRVSTIDISSKHSSRIVSVVFIGLVVEDASRSGGVGRNTHAESARERRPVVAKCEAVGVHQFPTHTSSRATRPWGAFRDLFSFHFVIVARSMSCALRVNRVLTPTCRLATDSRRHLDPTQGPTKTPQRDHLFLLRFFQDITHANRG